MWNYVEAVKDLQKQTKWITHAISKIASAKANIPDFTTEPTLFTEMGTPEDQVTEARAEFSKRHALLVKKINLLSMRYAQVANDLQHCLEDCNECQTMMESKGFLEKYNRFRLLPGYRRTRQKKTDIAEQLAQFVIRITDRT